MKTTTKVSKKQIFGLSVVAAVIVGAIFVPIVTSASGPTIRQGTTSTYGVLAGSTVTNTGATTISGSAGGDIGLAPGTSYTGSETVTRSGVDHIADGAATIAQADLVTAYGDAAALTPTILAAQDLAGQTLSPGVYSTTEGTFSNSGALILDGGGDASAVFVFQAASTVITSTNSTMTLTGGAQACNVFWQVGSSATVGGNSTFVGHIYAMESITANGGATIYGQLLARTSAVTLINNTIVNNSCVTAEPTPTPTSEAPAPAAPSRPIVPAVPQDSTITGISSSECTTTSDYTAYILGNFPTRVANVAVDGRNIPEDRWSQSLGQISVVIPASDKKSFSIDIYNGMTPLLPTQVFLCSEPSMVAPTPEPIQSAIDEPTETGGILPATGSSGYNLLLVSGVLILLGGAGYLIRRRSIK